MVENSLKTNFALEQTTLQFKTEGIVAQSFGLGKSLQAGDKTGKLSHALERLGSYNDQGNVTFSKCSLLDQQIL